MTALRSANLAVAFILELAMLAALAVWGWSAGSSTATRLVLAIAAPLAAVAVWAVLLAPRSARRLRRPLLELAKAVLFVLAALGLWSAGHPVWAVSLFVIFAVSMALAVAWEQDEVAGRTG